MNLPTIGELPTIGSYGKYSSGNYGVNCQYMDLGNIELYYSYETIIGYRTNGGGLVLTKNVWGTTTGKHLNWLDRDKSKRIPYDDFKNRLKSILSDKFSGEYE